MTAPQMEIQLIASVVAVACALPGVFLVLRRMAMMSDAISHSILLGIVLAFFLVRDLSSPFLVLAAALAGRLTVSLVERLRRTDLVREDAAIGLVFPAMFSAGVILISRYAGSVHLDVDSVLLGELAFAPFHRLVLSGTDVGPKGLWLMSAILLLNLAFILAFYKELKVATFDEALAGALGLAPAAVHYVLMSLVAVTAVGAFDAVGSILVVALMIGPPATAYLLTDRLSRMLAGSALIGVLCAVGGYWTAHWLDASIAGCMASVAGLVFLAAFLAVPGRGLVAVILQRGRQRIEFARTMLVVHLYHHEGLPEERRENRMAHLEEHLRWSPEFAERVVSSARRNGMVSREDDVLLLTEEGREQARGAMVG